MLHNLRHRVWNHLTPQFLLDFVTQKPSRLKAPEVAETWDELGQLDHLIASPGPSSPIREDIRMRANRICARLEAKTLPNHDELRQYIRALEVLRDIGAETQLELLLCQHRAWAIVQYYFRLKDFPCLARALHCYGNTARLLGDQRTNWQMIRYARYILEESRVALSSKSQFMRLISTTVDMRSCAEGYGDYRANSMPRISGELAETIGTPLARLHAWQELAGYYRMRGNVEKAEESFATIDKLKQAIPAELIDPAPSIRARIELYIGRDRDRAIELIEQEYLAAYQANPRNLYRGHLQRWSLALRIPIPHLQVQAYETPMVFYAPRGEL